MTVLTRTLARTAARPLAVRRPSRRAWHHLVFGPAPFLARLLYWSQRHVR